MLTPDSESILFERDLIWMQHMAGLELLAKREITERKIKYFIYALCK